jgi:hypothetical protein
METMNEETKKREFGTFYNTTTQTHNLVYIETDGNSIKFIACVSPEKNADGKYEVYCNPYNGGKMTFTDSLEDAKEAILEYFSG